MKLRSLATTCLIGALILFCLAGLCFGGLAIALPGRAVRLFGPPAPSLGLFDRIFLSARLLSQANDLTQPRDPLGLDQLFQVELGESIPSITDHLELAGLIDNAAALRDYLVYTGLDTSLQAGKYTFSPKLTAIEIAQAMQDATPQEVEFRILPGWRLEEIAEALPTSGLSFSPQEFLILSKTPELLSPVPTLPQGATLEGYLFPDQYQLPRQIGVLDFLQIILGNFENQVTPDLKKAFESQGLDIHQAVTLASIVQREAVVEEEMPLIASVFLNRLAAGVKLDSDPTVQYALGYNPAGKTWWTNPLSAADLQVNSHYNTYLYPGLPPGPIANPGLEALRAVAYPAETPYFYFRAACDGSGSHLFAQTFEEHLNNACP